MTAYESLGIQQIRGLRERLEAIEALLGGGLTSLNGLTDATQAFTKADDSNVTLGITSAAGVHTLAMGWTGVLPVARGGTGLSTAKSVLRRCLDADATGVNGTSAQPWFPTLGTATLASSKLYRFSGLLALTHGTTSMAAALNFGGTATYTILQSTNSIRRIDGQVGNTSHRAWRSSAADLVISPASTVGGGVYLIDGTLRCTVQGTFIPQFVFSAAPGGTVTTKAGSFFELVEWGSNTFTVEGNWA